MSTETLSQQEIDALLDGGRTAMPTAAVEQGDEVQIYDFRRPHRVSKERLRIIEAMYERLATSLETWLVGRVRRQVTLRLEGVEQFSFGEFTMSLSTPCASFGFDIKNSLGRRGVIDVGHEFAYFLVDRFFGGAGLSAKPQRGLTPIERLAVRIVVERITVLMTEIWKDHIDLDLDLTTFESFPEMVQGTSQDDPVLVASIEISAEKQSSLILLCLPFDVLEKFFLSTDQNRSVAAPTTEPERRMTRERTEASVRMVNVDISARLPEFHMPMRQLLGLPVGSVLTTGIPTLTPLDVFVNGTKRYNAAAGRVGQQLAVRILDTPSADARATTASFS